MVETSRQLITVPVVAAAVVEVAVVDSIGRLMDDHVDAWVDLVVQAEDPVVHLWAVGEVKERFLVLVSMTFEN